MSCQQNMCNPHIFYNVRNTVDQQSGAMLATSCVLSHLYEVNRSTATGEKYVTTFNTNFFPQVVYSHDLSRVVQWLLKIGTPDLRAAITEELTSHVPAMLQSKYACFCVKRMLKYGSHNSRKSIVRSLHGKVVKLASHSVSFYIIYTVSLENVGIYLNVVYGVSLYEKEYTIFTGM